MPNINRLLNLAKYTGNTIIVHSDDQQQDMVILPIDSYEELVLNTIPATTHQTSNREKIAEINEELAKLYEQYDHDSHEVAAELTSPTFSSESNFQHQEEFLQEEPQKNWEQAANLLQERYKLYANEEVSPEEPRSFMDDDLQRRYEEAMREEQDRHRQIRHVPLKEPYAEMSWEDEDNQEGNDPIFLEEPII